MAATFSTRKLTTVVAFSWGCEVEQTADRHCHQLGRRPSPRQEIRGLGILLCQRHSFGYSGITEVGLFYWWALKVPCVEPNFKIKFSECLIKILWFHQISPASPLHRHWHPPRRWRGGGFLHHRSCDDGFIPQVRRVLPRHGRPEGKLLLPGRYVLHCCSHTGR